MICTTICLLFWTQLQKNPDPLINRLLELKDEACRADGVEELEKKHRFPLR